MFNAFEGITAARVRALGKETKGDVVKQRDIVSQRELMRTKWQEQKDWFV